MVNQIELLMLSKTAIYLGYHVCLLISGNYKYVHNTVWIPIVTTFTDNTYAIRLASCCKGCDMSRNVVLRIFVSITLQFK